MSVKSVEQPADRPTAKSVDPVPGNPPGPTMPPPSSPLQSGPPSEVEIRDPMGNFSEQIGAYFG